MPTFTLSPCPPGTREVFEYLRICARDMYTDNYKHICDEVDRLYGVKVLPVSIGDQLGPIRSECIAHNVPWINALAVGLAKAHYWRPSEGFLPNNVNWHPSHELLWRGMVLQVYSYDWNSVTVI